jgi:hypothetical protein
VRDAVAVESLGTPWKGGGGGVAVVNASQASSMQTAAWRAGAAHLRRRLREGVRAYTGCEGERTRGARVCLVEST